VQTSIYPSFPATQYTAFPTAITSTEHDSTFEMVNETENKFMDANPEPDCLEI